jgi:hypothetical protein
VTIVAVVLYKAPCKSWFESQGPGHLLQKNV